MNKHISIVGMGHERVHFYDFWLVKDYNILMTHLVNESALNNQYWLFFLFLFTLFELKLFDINSKQEEDGLNKQKIIIINNL